jgi:hypothetical protein
MTRTSRFLIQLLPERYRDEIAGDLVENATPHINAELVSAAIRLFPLNFRQSEDDNMKHAKWIAAAAILAVGLLQAWDSGILNAPVWIAALVLVAIALGIGGLFTENEPVRIGIAALVFILLFVARIVSPVRLPELTLVGLPIFLLLVCGPRFMGLAKAKNPPRGPGAVA